MNPFSYFSTFFFTRLPAVTEKQPQALSCGYTCVRLRIGLVPIIMALAWLASGSASLHAKLPSLKNAPWLGFFTGHTGTRGMFGIAQDGSLYYNHINDGRSVNSGYFHRIHPAVTETRPDGTVRIHRFLPETLKTEMEATDKPGTITYRGQVKGGASIEVVVEFTRRDVSIGGRIVDPGPGNYPLQFCFYTQAPAFYLTYGEREILKGGSAEAKAKLEKQIARQKSNAAKESLDLRRLDGKRVKLPLLDKVDLSSPTLNGDGFTAIDVDLGCLKGRKIGITATEGSRMKLSHKEPRPIFKYHYNITWMEDPASSPAGRARMVFTTR